MGKIVAHHLKSHTGVGIVCAVAYFDPRPKNPLLYRWLGLYPLYVLSEVAIIATDLAELLGSAIALCMLFPKLQLWHGVLITAFDVFILLLFGDPLRGRPVRMFEFIIAGLVLAVLICIVIIISRVYVDWAKAFEGYLPSKYVFSSGALYTSVGILGATVMPHSLFLGSALATQDRIPPASQRPGALLRKDTDDSQMSYEPSPSVPIDSPSRAVSNLPGKFASLFRAPLQSDYTTSATRHADWENRPYAFVKSHIYHGIADVVISLFGFAVLINSLDSILILASAVFFYSGAERDAEAPASLFDAYDLIRNLVGKGAATLFAVALLAAGQPAIRRIITRLIAIVPSMVVAIAVGRPGIDALLVISQVVLSIVLPFIMVPLIYCTSSKAVMSVRKTRDDGVSPALPLDTALRNMGPRQREDAEVEAGTDEMVDFSSGWFATGIGAMICLIVAAANVFPFLPQAHIMPRTGGSRNRNRGAARQGTLPANPDDALNEFFENRDGFSHNPSNPVWKEFRRLARYLHWTREEIATQKEYFKDVLVQTFNHMYGTDENSLESWTALCHVLQIAPVPEGLHACREAVKAVHVNLVDLVEHPQTGEPLLLFNSEAELSEYTQESGKFFPKESAYAGGLLKHLLRHILNPRTGLGASSSTRQFFKDRDGFSYNPSKPAWQEYRRLAHHLQWDKETAEHRSFKTALVRTFNDTYGMDENSLESWTALYRVLHVTPIPEDVLACKKAIKSVFVNLVDLVDHYQTGKPVRLFSTEVELSKYTQRTRKFFPKENVHAGGLLKHLLRQINKPRMGLGAQGPRRRKRRRR
ncbi:hypothetical protein C0993_003904 [Termitomyces sp. T159_Od127]|nr:hypothetical protein C0993_003904 [Termitomyces sp. T159_Od127]